jgi:hypothetical protein
MELFELISELISASPCPEYILGMWILRAVNLLAFGSCILAKHCMVTCPRNSGFAVTGLKHLTIYHAVSLTTRFGPTNILLWVLLVDCGGL